MALHAQNYVGTVICFICFKSLLVFIASKFSISKTRKTEIVWYWRALVYLPEIPYQI